MRWGEGLYGAYVAKWIAPSQHTISVEVDVEKGTGKKDRAARLRKLCVPMPGLVFVGMGTSYALFAVRGDAAGKDGGGHGGRDKLNPKAAAYIAPLPNVYSSGRVCWGANQPPVAGAGSMQRAWELFIGSPFNADLASGKSKSHKEDVRAQLLNLSKEGKVSKEGADRYPEEDLLPYTYLRSKSSFGHNHISVDELVTRIAAGEIEVEA